MKVNMSNNKIETIVCPVCGLTSEVIRVVNIKINDVMLLLHDDVGEIYQCLLPGCMEYLEKVNDEYKFISKQEIIRRQKEITDLLVAESEVARARLVPAVVEAEISKAEAGRLLSRVLYFLTAGSDFRRAYSVEEILEACAAVGLQPDAVDNSTIPLVVGWLEEHKGI